ncbi:MAG: hypothetical protein R3E79_00725 [Caldilineaceae bacterium]
MENNRQLTATAAVAVVQEPLELYYPFIRNGALIQRAQTPQLVEAYLRWQYVRRGGIGAYAQLDFAFTGWEGYVVGLPPEQQSDTLQALGENMLQRLSYVGRRAGIPPDRLLAEVAEERFTQRTAHLLEPIFFSALTSMRATGQEGFAMHAYSGWRTAYEQELFRLEQALQAAQCWEEKRTLSNQIVAKQWELRQKIAEVTHGRLAAAALYEEVHNRVASQVTDLVQTVAAPLSVDVQAARVRYLLPAVPGMNTAAEETVSGRAPEWYIALHNLPLIGHPLIRAAIATG